VYILEKSLAVDRKNFVHVDSFLYQVNVIYPNTLSVICLSPNDLVTILYIRMATARWRIIFLNLINFTGTSDFILTLMVQHI